jgi:hypothetical protein
VLEGAALSPSNQALFLDLARLSISLSLPIRRAVRMEKEKMRLRRSHLSVIAHPKSGSTWLRFQLARLYQKRYGLPETVLPRLERLPRLDSRVPYINMVGYEFIKRRVTEPPPLADLSGRRIVFLSRHPCDVVVSLYFHVLKHATLQRKLFNRWPLDLAERSIFDFVMNDPWGLNEAIGFYNRCAVHMRAMPEALLVRYEDMRADPKRELKRIVALAGADFSEDEIDEAVAFASFDNLRKMERDDTLRTTRLRPGDVNDTDSYKVRRGKVGGFREYFSAEEAARLEALVGEKLDPVFGYARQAERLAI